MVSFYGQEIQCVLEEHTILETYENSYHNYPSITALIANALNKIFLCYHSDKYKKVGN